MKVGLPMYPRQEKAREKVGQAKVDSEKTAQLVFEAPAEGFFPMKLYQQHFGKVVEHR